MKERRQLLLIALWMVLVLSTRFLKISFGFTEQTASIRLFAISVPLIAYFFPLRHSLPLISIALFALKGFHLIPITLGVPTLLATLSWSYSRERGAANLLLHCAFPLVAMALFALAPAGSHAWPYSLYWLIPVACSLLRPSLWSRALQSTFVAHAAGSLIWAYVMPVSEAYWIQLIPVVALERLISVAFSVGLLGLMISAERYLQTGRSPVRAAQTSPIDAELAEAR